MKQIFSQPAGRTKKDASILPTNWSDESGTLPDNWLHEPGFLPDNWLHELGFLPDNWSHEQIVVNLPTNWTDEIKWRMAHSDIWCISSRKRNNEIRCINGNIRKAVTVVHWNMGNKFWRNKVPDIQHMLQDRSPDIAFISEANIFSSDKDYELHIPNYKLIMSKTMNRLQNSRIAALVHEKLEVKLLDQYMNDSVASIWLKISARGRKSVHLGAIYREHQWIYQPEPNLSGSIQAQEERWRQFIIQWEAAGSSADTIVVGDTNLDYNKWDIPEQNHRVMVDMVKTRMETAGFSQMVIGDTRFWQGTTPSLVDQCWSNCQERILRSENIPRASSDHNLQEISVRISGNPFSQKEVLMRDRSSLDTKDLEAKAADIDWTEMLNSENLDLANDFFEREIKEIMNDKMPLIVRQMNKKDKKWIKKETRDEMNLRDRLRETANQSQSQLDWNLYRTQRNKCTKIVRENKKEHFENLFKKCEDTRDVGKLYNTVKSQLGWNTNGPPTSMLVDGKITKSSQLIANAQLKYYKTKIENLMNNLPIPDMDPTYWLRKCIERWGRHADARPEFDFREVTLAETDNLLKSLGNSATFGHDEIDAKTLKILAKHTIKPIKHLINLSLKHKKFAMRWKIGRIIPLFKGKKLDRNSPASYRPVCLLPVISKLVEKAAQQQMVTYLDETNQLNNNNNAYRRKFSSVTALMQISDSLHEAADLKSIANIMTIDETSAFDCISHATLDRKLELYNFGGGARAWIQDYLVQRSQYVSIGARRSEMMCTKFGVPQGSVMGPILYSLYINEMPSILRRNETCRNNLHNSRPELLFPPNCPSCPMMPSFADDATVITIGKSRPKNQQELTENLKIIKHFLNVNNLTMNESKTTVVESMVPQKRGKIGGQKPYLDTVGLDGRMKRITAGNYTRILGYNLQENLSQQAHISTGEINLIGELRAKLGAIKTLRQATAEE